MTVTEQVFLSRPPVVPVLQVVRFFQKRHDAGGLKHSIRRLITTVVYPQQRL